MKLTAILFLAICIQLSARTIGQTVTLSVKNRPVKEVFREIQKQTGLNILVNENILAKVGKVTMKVRNMPVSEVLDLCFRDKQLSYNIIAETIVVKPQPPEVLQPADNSLSIPPPIDIRGKVTDEKGLPFAGVSVSIVGVKEGVVTDEGGNFSIAVSENDVLSFSYVGYQTVNVPVKGKTRIDITLTLEVSSLNDVVVIGYGTQKKVNLTGAVDVVTAEALRDRPNANVGQLLQGLSPNLNITPSGFGGEPGSGTNFNIRGTGTLSGANSPLVLVDGVEMNIDNLDPATVESVSVLKDAASSAIYGARAPFGVVLITTKKGSKNKKVSVSYTNNTAFASPIFLPEWQSSIRYVTAYNQALQNSGLPDKFLPAQIDRIERYIAGTYKPEYDTVNPPSRVWGGRHEGNANYEWFDMYFKDVTVNQKHNINISGGDEKNQFYVSMGYYDQGSAYNWINEYYRRYNVSANLTSQATPWLQLNIGTKYANTRSRHPNYFGDGSDNRTYMISELIGMYPTTPMYNVNGTINNPIAVPMMKGGPATGNENDLLVGLGVEIEPITGWKTNINYNYNHTAGINTYLDAKILVEIPNGQLLNEGYDPDQFRQNWNSNDYHYFYTTSSYEKFYSGHFFKAMIGYEKEYRYYSNIGGSKYNLITEDVPSFTTATGAFDLFDGMSHSATEAVFGRLNYNYKEKYLLEINARYNGSSRFAKDSRWGFFPSVSAGYNIAKEPFWKPLVHDINTFKLRASYGTLGNQNVDNYLYLSNIPILNNLDWIIDNRRPLYSTMPAIKSPTLTWETIGMLNLGADIGFFNNRLELGFDWYERNTSNMFGPSMILPATLGAPPPLENNASMRTKGWEVSLAWRDGINRDLSYSARFTLADNRSRVTKFLNTAGLISEWYVGKEVGEIWGFTTAGIIQTEEEAAAMPDQSYLYSNWGPGDIKYSDLNGDAKIDAGNGTLSDHGDLSVIGNSSPRYSFGFTGSVRWRNFDFSMFWHGILKRDLPSEGNQWLYWGVGSRGNSGGVFFEGHDDYWRPADEKNLFGPNTDAYYAKPYVTDETNKNHAVQTRYLRSTAFIALKNLQFGYTIPQKLTEKIRVQSVKMYVSGENLKTFDKLPGFINPELAYSSNIQQGAIYPMSRSFSVGLNITF